MKNLTQLAALVLIGAFSAHPAYAQVPISSLPAATTPLAGTESVPLVQGGVTKKVDSSFLGAACTFANPTATSATAAVNGSASTCMRSDAAPALGTTSGTGALIRGTSPAITTPTGIVKGDVGLGNVDNTSDATKNAASVTLTNKTLTAPVLTAPVLGTPASGNASNMTSIPVAQATGVLPAANGGAGTASGVLTANGSGTVAAATVGACLNYASATLAATYTINAQTGTSYTIQSTDACKLVTFSNGSAVAVTLPQAAGVFGAGWSFDTQNKGAGTVTITPTTSTINGSSTLTIATNKGCTIVSDGTNYQVSACTAL